MESKSPFIKSHSVPGFVTLPEVKKVAVRRRGKSPGRNLSRSALRTSASLGLSFENNSNHNSKEMIERPHKRRKTEQPTETIETGGQKSICRRMFSFIIRSVKYIMCSIFMLGFSLAVFSFAAIWINTRCIDMHSETLDLSSLQNNLKLAVHGQESAMNALMETLEMFDSKEGPSPNPSIDIVWSVGWSGGGKSKTMDVLQKSLKHQTNIQYILPSFIPDNQTTIHTLVDESISHIKSSCRKDIIIIDGWDDKETSVITFASILVSKLQSLKHVNGKHKHLLLIISGTKGSKFLNKEYLSHRLLDKERADMPLDALINVVKRSPEYIEIKSLGPISIVPFLPLEKEHIEMCVQKELKRLRKMFDGGVLSVQNKELFNVLNEREISSFVVGSLKFVPPELPILSPSGCKRVVSLLKLKLGDIELARPSVEL